MPRKLATFAVIPFAVALGSHLLPGFHNLQAIPLQSMTPRSAPYTMFLNLDKPLFGIFFLYFAGSTICRQTGWINISEAGIKALIGVVAIVVPTAYFANWIDWDPKWTQSALLWSANNLLLTCVAEEVFFRGFIQKSFTEYLETKQVRNGAMIALTISSVIFGVAHFGGGLTFVALSTLAGFFYGLAFYWSRSIESAIFAHFGLNFIHYSLFTYPYALH